VDSDQLAAAKQQRDSVKERLRLMRQGDMKSKAGPQLEYDTTDVTIAQGQQQLEALVRKIERLEKEND
jgi:hypothetical protein